jgi:hypothetical protein
MMKCGFLLALLSLAYVGTTGWIDSQKQLPSADQIVERHVQALGGRDRVEAVHSVVQHLVYREGSMVIPDAFIARMRPYYKTIADPKDKNLDINEGYDGRAWEYYADPGVVLRTVGAAAAAGRHGTEIIDALVDYRAQGTRIDKIEADTFAGRPAYKLHMTLEDGFEKDVFLDQQSYLIVGDRRSAPIHAFGSFVRSENRIGDYHSANGVLFPYTITEIEMATGRELNSSTVQSITVNELLDVDFFSPPQYQRTPLQQMLEQLYMERTDPICVMSTYRGFRAAHPGVETRAGVEFIGYQMAKMGDFAGAIRLMTANAADYPTSASAQFALGRAYKAAGDVVSARHRFQKALQIDPDFKKASDGLNALR